MHIALRLADEGMWGGDPEKVLAAGADVVMAAVQYLKYKRDYETTYIELNKERR